MMPYPASQITRSYTVAASFNGQQQNPVTLKCPDNSKYWTIFDFFCLDDSNKYAASEISGPDKINLQRDDKTPKSDVWTIPRQTSAK